MMVVVLQLIRRPIYRGAIHSINIPTTVVPCQVRQRGAHRATRMGGALLPTNKGIATSLTRRCSARRWLTIAAQKGTQIAMRSSQHFPTPPEQQPPQRRGLQI